MANPNIKDYGRETRFSTGQSGNPGGKPAGARNKIQGVFLSALADDFEQHGNQAIQQMREKDPSGYIRVVASLMPKDVEISRSLNDISDEQLDAAIAALQASIATQGAAN